jgi:hypothetical protein
MAVLSPYGYLLIFLAVQLAPSDSNQITIQFGAYEYMILVQNDQHEWVRSDNDTVVRGSFKVDGANLVMRASEEKEYAIYLAKEFKITGKEKWREVKKIDPVKPEGEWVQLQLSERKLIAVATKGERKIQSEISWAKVDH